MTHKLELLGEPIRRKIKKMGGTLYISLPVQLCRILGFKEETDIEIRLVKWGDKLALLVRKCSNT